MTMDAVAARRLSTLEPGDIVALRSGGPRMTVVTVEDDEVECAWFVGGDLVTKTIPIGALRYLDLIGSIAHWLTSD